MELALHRNASSVCVPSAGIDPSRQRFGVARKNGAMVVQLRYPVHIMQVYTEPSLQTCLTCARAGRGLLARRAIQSKPLRGSRSHRSGRWCRALRKENLILSYLVLGTDYRCPNQAVIRPCPTRHNAVDETACIDSTSLRSKSAHLLRHTYADRS